MWRIIIVLLLLWGAGESWSGVSNFSRNEHHREAGIWLAGYTQHEGVLITNSRKVAYYSGRYRDPNIWESDTKILLRGLLENRWPSTQFAAVRLQRGEDNLEFEFNDALRRAPVRVFENDRGDRVLLYDYTDFCGSIPCN